MIKHKVKTAKFGTDFLGVFYKRRTYEERKYYLREIANRGASFIRIFNCDKDSMKFSDYNDKYWAELERNLKFCLYEVNGKQMIIPILSLGGYWRINKKKLTQGQWEWVFGKAIDVGIKALGKKNFMVEIVNEPFTYTPRGWKKTKPATMHNKMYDMGLWHAHMVKLCMNKGLKIGQIMVNVIDVPDKGDPEIRDNIYYPRNAKTADMILGKVGKLKHRRDVIASYHQIHFPNDWRSKYGGKRIYVTQISRFWVGTNDGDSAIGKKGSGVDPSPLLTGRFKTIDKRELADVSYESFRIARDGIRHGKVTHKVMIWYADLGRDYFTWDITWYCKKCGYKLQIKGLTPKDERPEISRCPDCASKIYLKFKLVGDMKNIDYERIDVMERQYFRIFKKHSPSFGKFPEPEKEEILEPIKPIKPIIKEKTMRQKLNEMWFKFFRGHFKAFWNESVWEQKVSAISILIYLIFLIWILIIIF